MFRRRLVSLLNLGLPLRCLGVRPFRLRCRRLRGFGLGNLALRCLGLLGFNRSHFRRRTAVRSGDGRPVSSGAGLLTCLRRVISGFNAYQRLLAPALRRRGKLFGPRNAARAECQRKGKAQPRHLGCGSEPPHLHL